MPSYQCRGKNKLWSVRFTIIENGEEIQKRLSSDDNGNNFARKKDAEAAYVRFMDQYNRIPHQKSQAVNILDRKFTEVFEEYKVYKKDKVKDSSYYELVKSGDKHIIPFFSPYKMKDITKLVVLNWQQSLSKYSYMYKKKLRGMLYSFYKYLSYYDVDNVVARVEPFKKPNDRKEMQIWTLPEFNAFINTFEKNEIMYRAFFSFLYYSGCRLGEVLALNYEDLDFKNRTISINKNITGKVYELQGKQSYAVTSPKNASSYRKILIPNKLVEILTEYIDMCPECKTSQFLFGLDKPLNDYRIYSTLQNHTTQSKNKPIRIHDFRHSHASLLVHAGANIVLIAKRLGHSDTQQTLNTYSHLYPDSEQQLMAQLDAI